MANSKRLKNVMSPEVLQQKAAAQISLEKRGSLVIKSIEKTKQPPKVTKYYVFILALLYFFVF